MINLRNQDYRLPGNNEELNEMIEKMIDCGMSTKSAEAEIKKRKKQYEVAVKKYVTYNGQTFHNHCYNALRT